MTNSLGSYDFHRQSFSCFSSIHYKVCLFVMSVGTTALSHLKLASNRTCHENCCAEGLPVTLEGHFYRDFTDFMLQTYVSDVMYR